LYGKEETDKLVAEFVRCDKQAGPPFKITSCFPFRSPEGENAKRIYYLPAPLTLMDCFSPDIRKEAKKTRFIDHETYWKWVEGNLGDHDFARIKESSDALQDAMAVRANVHVALDRPRLAGNPYYVSRLHCSKGSGFYLLYSCGDEYAKRFKAALRLLGDMGIGGERSSGCGAFEVDFVEDALSPSHQPGETGAWMSLSLVFPTKDDLTKLSGAVLRLRERKGWISSPFTADSYRRKRVFMLDEGSLFAEKIEGCLPDVTPSIWKTETHPVYRYGLAWLIPARSGA
jgi:CRISPR-associated protein Csm4